jgi:CHAT domain-containing protein
MPKRVRILVTTADAKVHRDSATGEVQLKQLVAEYRQSLQNANRDPRPQAKALYDALIGPIVNDLAQAGPATLMFSLDGVLRYLPMAALYDGQHWLIENGSRRSGAWQVWG